MPRVYTTLPIADRFWPKVNKTDTCWLWTASRGGGNNNNYGAFGFPNHKKVYAHRVAYELVNGPIPPGLHIDHLCRVTLCVNPAHLEAVSQAENNRRSDSVCAKFARQTHCKRGHPLSGDNLYLLRWDRGSGFGRNCRACHALRERWRREASKPSRAAGGGA
jgi:hypothetical protein